MFQADPYSLRYLAQQILAGVEQSRRKADQLNNTVQGLVNGSNGWKGDGANGFKKRGEILVSEMRKACNQLESIVPILQTLARRVEDIQNKQRELVHLQNQLNAMHGGWDIKNDAEIVYLEGRVFALRGEIEAESVATDISAAAAFEAIQFSESLQEQMLQLSQVASTVAHKTEEVWDNYVKPAGEWLLNGVEEFLDIPEMVDAWHDLTNPNLSMGERLLAAGKIVAYGALDVSMLFGVGDVVKGVQLLAKFGAKYAAKLLLAEGRKEMAEAITKGLSDFADGVKSGAEQLFSRGTPGKYRLALEDGRTVQDLKISRVKYTSAGESEIQGTVSAEGTEEAVSKIPPKKLINPLDDPGIAKEITSDPDAVYGYSPKMDSSLAKFGIDWTNPEEVAFARSERIKYLEKLQQKKKLLEEEVEALKKEGKTVEDIARKKVEQRNQDRINSYLKSDNMKGLKSMQERNLKEYGRAEGPTPEQLFMKYGSWEEVIFGTVRSSPAMDVLTGLY